MVSEIHHFNAVDGIFLAIIALSSLIGLMRGVTREVMGIAGWVGAILAVVYGLPVLRPLGREYIKNPMIADAVVAIGIFVISLSVLIIISRLVSNRIKVSILGGLDKSFGLLFGLFRGGVVICLIFMALTFFYGHKHLPESLRTAKSTPWVREGAQFIHSFIPQELMEGPETKLAIPPLDAKDLIENHLGDIEKTVQNLSTLKPKKDPKPEHEGYEPDQLNDMERLLNAHDDKKTP
ncbi:CvpA family protein [Candidatus Bealeia paramacronuclearis]|uniref:CvpA family protein n=1 Tax=Candidatus Bealeia paramacronuclearis TaxID=1921001 RepID=A0ABZ2C402_9PROT|nr:CvpA family protein [Candidatus Bealeia paramacronuclearis]